MFPAIDLEASVSRAMTGITDENQQELARALKELYSVYRQNKDLISIGAYEHGSDPKIDQALRAHEPLRQLVRQAEQQKVTMTQSVNDLVNTARYLSGSAHANSNAVA